MSGRHDRGMALVLVLVFATVIGGLSANLLLGLRDGGKMADGVEQLLKRRIASDAAIEVVVARLRDPSAEPFSSMAFEIGQVAINVSVTPEGERVDLNLASVEEIETWIANALEDEVEDAPQLALELAHRLVDWRDEDDLRQLEGAELDDYRRAGLDYVPADGPFRHVNELRDILGMTDEVFQLLRTSAAVATGRTTPPPETTEPEGEEEATETQADEPQAGEADQKNIYRIVIEARSQQQGYLASQATVWIEPNETDVAFEMLDYQPFVLPQATE